MNRSVWPPRSTIHSECGLPTASDHSASVVLGELPWNAKSWPSAHVADPFGVIVRWTAGSPPTVASFVDAVNPGRPFTYETRPALVAGMSTIVCVALHGASMPFGSSIASSVRSGPSIGWRYARPSPLNPNRCLGRVIFSPPLNGSTPVWPSVTALREWTHVRDIAVWRLAQASAMAVKVRNRPSADRDQV